MHFGDFGQPRAQAILQDLFLRHKLAGSFLFDGPAGTGKEALAIEVGRLLNCEREGGCPPRGLFRTPPTADDGDACSSCKRWHSLQHPDLHLVFPVATGIWDEATKPDFKLPADWRAHPFKSIAEVLAAKARDPYFKPVFRGDGGAARPVSIQAEVLRDIVLPAVHRRPVEARMKVVIIADAEQMAFGIGNLLLKTLEEPPLDCLLVLTSSVPERLLPTIRSRCQRIGFAPLSVEWMLPRLDLLHPSAAADGKRHPNEDKKAAANHRTAAYLLQGSMVAAERYLDGALREVRDRAFEIFLAAAACVELRRDGDDIPRLERQTLELLDLAKKISDVKTDRHLLPLLLQILASIARDALLVMEGAHASAPGALPAAKALPHLVHDDSTKLETLAKTFDATALRNIVRQTQRAERQLAGHAHAELTLTSFCLGLARARAQARPQSARA